MELTESPIGRWVSPVAGVTAAALVSLWACRVPRAHWLSWTDALVLASSYVGVIFLTCIVVAGIAAVLFPKAWSRKPGHLALRVSAAAVWFVPLSLFLQQQSGFAMAAAAVLAAAITAAVYGWQLPEGSIEAEGADGNVVAAELFGSLYVQPLLRDLLPALCVSLFAEVAVVADLVDKPTMAAGLAAVFGALMVRSLKRRVLRYAPVVADGAVPKARELLLVGAAVMFAVIALMPYLRMGGGGSAARNVPGARLSDNERSQARPVDTEGPADLSGYPGILLWPKTPNYVKLVAPPLTVASNQTTLGLRPPEITIPFDGVYWFFKAPDKRPSRNSHVAYGSPEQFNIRSIDQRPLLAEAHQNLGTLINLKCCSRIQVELQDADHYPGTVSVELVVRNTSLPGKPSRSLGTVGVFPASSWQLSERRMPRREALDFAVSSEGLPQQFDEFIVVFRLTPDRSFQAAKMGIKGFVLVPR